MEEPIGGALSLRLSGEFTNYATQFSALFGNRRQINRLFKRLIFFGQKSNTSVNATVQM